MANMTYDVGQILYVIPAGQVRLIPVQVIEEITKKTLNGEVVSYMIKMGTANESKVIDISQLNGEVFDSAENARIVLVERSTKAISTMIEQATKLAGSWYSSHSANNKINSVKRTELNETEVSALLEDGTQVRVRLPNSV